MLAFSERSRPMRTGDTIHDIMNSGERGSILDWLRHQPLAIHDESRNILMTHAGVHPLWSLHDCLGYAAEIEDALKGSNYTRLMRNLYGNKPTRLSPNHGRIKRLRFLINSFTRMRYLKLNGKLDLEHVGPPGSQPKNRVAWFEHPSRVPITPTVVFGHWASLGLYNANGVLCLDSGCCWGRSLSAARLDTPKIQITKMRCR